MGSAVVASVYLMTDAVVIGKGIGDNALAALNMTTPIISFMLSIGILFGIGGSVLFSVHKGTGDDEKANKMLYHSFARCFDGRDNYLRVI